MTELTGRLALVTGGGRGIGKGIAIMLAQAGADVAINYRRDQEAAEETAEVIRALGRRTEVYAASVEDERQDVEMVDRILDELGPVGILVNNAGIASRGRTVADTDSEETARVVDIHVVSIHHLCRLLLPSMRALDRGDIIMISSVATRNNGANGAPYNMAKVAMEALALTLAKEEIRHNVRVNIVAPGLVETDMGARLMRALRGTQSLRELDASMPMGRVCQPEDIARAVLYLVSPENAYVTGQRLYVEGGGTI